MRRASRGFRPVVVAALEFVSLSPFSVVFSEKRHWLVCETKAASSGKEQNSTQINRESFFQLQAHLLVFDKQI